MEKLLKVLALSTSDISGGAARAAYRIHKAVRLFDVDSKMIVKNKYLDDALVTSVSEFEPTNFVYKLFHFVQHKIKNKIQHSRWNKYPDKENVFLSDLRSVSLHGALKKIDYDILHLHWFNLRFLDIKELLKIQKPIIWTLHDSWAITGICHYSDNCNRYRNSCGSCPFLKSEDNNDLSRKILLQKAKIYKLLNLNIVTPSRWLADNVAASSLLSGFPITVIANPLDTEVYKPGSKMESCNKWNLKPTTKRILFAAMNATSDKRKGFDELMAAIVFFAKDTIESNIELLIFGANMPINEMQTTIPVHYLGHLSDDIDIVSAYNAADVMVVPSLSEVFGQTASEAMACGVPVVAFNCTGIKEVVDHKITGYLAEPYSAEDLANGIVWCLENNTNNLLSFQARQKVENNYSSKVVGEKYAALYKSVSKM